MARSLHNIQYRAHQRLAGCQYAPAVAARFWHKVDRRGEAECWPWTASRIGRPPTKHGQFTLRVAGTQLHLYAHRVSWELHYGPIPHGLQVLHRCDVAHCVNPAHLFLGTQDDNMKDAASKGRLHRPRTTNAFTLADRLSIYSLPYRRGLVVALARQYHVTSTAISLIRRGRFIGSPIDASHGCGQVA